MAARKQVMRQAQVAPKATKTDKVCPVLKSC